MLIHEYNIICSSSVLCIEQAKITQLCQLNEELQQVKQLEATTTVTQEE